MIHSNQTNQANQAHSYADRAGGRNIMKDTITRPAWRAREKCCACRVMHRHAALPTRPPVGHIVFFKAPSAAHDKRIAAVLGNGNLAGQSKNQKEKESLHIDPNSS